MSDNDDNCFVASPEAMESVREIIQDLPANNGHPFFQGFWCLPSFLEGIILAQQHFKAKPNDIFVCTAPKCGTTWIKALTFTIVSRTQFNSSTTPLMSRLSHDILPNLEILFGRKEETRVLGIPLIATHIPYPSLPKSVIESDCKIGYMCRNPKDMLVSMYYFGQTILRSKELKPVSFEDFFEEFCQGKSIYGPWWDHYLGYWKASLERPDKVLFLKYEDVMKDTEFYVKKLANFMGVPFSEDEEEEGAVEKIVEICSFEKMSNFAINKNGESSGVPNKAYFRKGQVGDWVNHLTPDMAHRLHTIVHQKLNGTGLSFN